MFLDIETASRHSLSRRFACLKTMLPGKPWFPIVSNSFGLVACCVSHCNSFTKKTHFIACSAMFGKILNCRQFAYSAINNTRRNHTPKMVRFPMTKIPGTLDSAQKRWAPGFPRVYFHIIHEYLKLAKWQIST